MFYFSFLNFQFSLYSSVQFKCLKIHMWLEPLPSSFLKGVLPLNKWKSGIEVVKSVFILPLTLIVHLVKASNISPYFSIWRYIYLHINWPSPSPILLGPAAGYCQKVLDLVPSIQFCSACTCDSRSVNILQVCHSQDSTTQGSRSISH